MVMGTLYPVLFPRSNPAHVTYDVTYERLAPVTYAKVTSIGDRYR